MGRKYRGKALAAVTVQFDTLAGNHADADKAFRDVVKSLLCPGCGQEFTDAAVDWSEIWWEGRFDLLHELGRTERDGPCKLKCERCGHRSWFNIFSKTVTSAERGPAQE